MLRVIIDIVGIVLDIAIIVCMVKLIRQKREA